VYDNARPVACDSTLSQRLTELFGIVKFRYLYEGSADLLHHMRIAAGGSGGNRRRPFKTEKEVKCSII